VNVRKGYELEGLFFGRPIRPFHLAITLATSVVAVSNLTAHEETFLGHTTSHFIGAFALVAVVFLFFGWVFNNEWSAEWGLLIAAGVWVARSVYIGMSDECLCVLGTIASVLLSIAWAIGAGGAYLLERYDVETRDGGE
jgi:hypothetical protein